MRQADVDRVTAIFVDGIGVVAAPKT